MSHKHTPFKYNAFILRPHLVCLLLCISFFSITVSFFPGYTPGMTAPPGFDKNSIQDFPKETQNMVAKKFQQSKPTEDGDFTTTVDPLFDEKTAIPESVIHDALNLDVGKYTTQRFDYFNMQNYQLPWARTTYHESPCVNDYIRCLLSQTTFNHVCGYTYNLFRKDRWIEIGSMCELYYDNCRRSFRYWIGYKLGPCYWKNQTGDFRVMYSYRSRK